MITTANGETHIHGDVSEVMTDLTVIIRRIRKTLEEEFGSERARKYIAQAGRLAFSSHDEIREECAQKLISHGVNMSVEDVVSLLRSAEESGCDADEFMKKLLSDANDKED